MTPVIRFYWCAACASSVAVVDFDSGCAKSNGGAHTRIGGGFTAARVSADLPSVKRAGVRKKKSNRSSSH